MKVYQQILRGPKSCNRGFRYRRLTVTECDALELKAAKIVSSREVDPDTMQGLIRQVRLKEGIREMLVAVTKKPVAVPGRPPKPQRPPPNPDGTQPPDPEWPEAEEPSLEDESLWEPLDTQKLMMPGEYNYDALFEPADHSALKVVFCFNHEADPGTVNDIIKKERLVSTGAGRTA